MKTKKPYLRLLHSIKGDLTVKKIEETKKEIDEKVQNNNNYDKDFVPHLWRKVERKMPKQISIFALIGVEKVFKINLPHNISLNMIPALIRKDYKLENGEALFFGKITGYYLHQNIGRSFEFDTKGELIAIHSCSPPHYGEKATIEFN